MTLILALVLVAWIMSLFYIYHMRDRFRLQALSGPPPELTIIDACVILASFCMTGWLPFLIYESLIDSA